MLDLKKLYPLSTKYYSILIQKYINCDYVLTGKIIAMNLKIKCGGENTQCWFTCYENRWLHITFWLSGITGNYLSLWNHVSTFMFYVYNLLIFYTIMQL